MNLQVHYIPIHLQPFYRKKYNYKKIFECKLFINRFSGNLPTLKMTDLYKVIKEIANIKIIK